MSRLIPESDMSADQIIESCGEAIALIHLCETAAWSLHAGNMDKLSDSIGAGLRLAAELLGPVYDCVERHEGVKVKP